MRFDLRSLVFENGTLGTQFGHDAMWYCKRLGNSPTCLSSYTAFTVQRRYDGTVDFYRFWDDYKTGFGNIAGEHWLGNDNLHVILRQRSYQVRFDFEDFAGNTSYAVYSTLYVGDESTNYKLNLTGYYGTAGNSMVSTGGISLTGTMFSTRDRDNDLGEKNCAIIKGGAWWYHSCSLANINGLYSEKDSNRAVHWKLWRGKTGLKKTMMMIKPKP
ncbi:Hypothetical predicted protein [Mytilus galloprovincialis]|uniref:Fibrinogen C-terminal domain-containing protein n=1 Tax=Mytilus galloprovincialis TaxID=29158 RepID=A0A8B6HK73_MYTGA|nr:Hypothetical predicted protein [Mytilus galloprovincialis]